MHDFVHVDFDKYTRQELLDLLVIQLRRNAQLQHYHEPTSDSRSCERCGRRDGLDTIISTEVWLKISPVKNMTGHLCLWCMDALCLDIGLRDDVTIYFRGDALVTNRHG